MKVTTDACLFGAWAAENVCNSELEARSRELKVLDIGTGTGLLSLMLAQKNPGLRIDAVEIDAGAAAQAHENIAASPWKKSIHVIHADALNYPFNNTYDIIISNPPFYEKELKGTDPKKNIAHHDEGLVLPDLLGIIDRYLSPGGTFYLLLPYKRDRDIRELTGTRAFRLHAVVMVRPATGQDYFRILLSGKRAAADPAETEIGEINITDTGGGYSPELIRLLHDFYLYL